MTANDILKRAKSAWGKALTSTILANENVNVYDWIGDAIVLLFSQKAIAKLSPSTGVEATFEEITTGSDVIDIDRKYLICLGDYVAARGFESDAENQNHQARAEYSMKMFTTFLGI